MVRQTTFASKGSTKGSPAFQTLLDLGKAALARGDFADAADALRQCTELQPKSSEAQSALGYALGRLDRFDDAIRHLTAALAVEPANWPALSHLSAILKWLGREQETIVWLERAVAAQPNLAAAHQLLGSLLHGMGRAQEARRELELAVALEPGNGHFHNALGETKRYAADDAHLLQMETLAQSNSQPELLFALAKANSEIGDHRHAFALLERANKQVRRQTVYDEKRMFATFEHAKALFTADFMRARATMGAPSDVPVFVVGMPRSGSTLLEQILACHKAVRGAGETRAYVKACAPYVKQFPTDAAKLDAEELRAIGETYLGLIAGGGATRVVDKMLSNFVLLGLIHLSLPGARIVHTVRDPVDTCLSCYATFFAESQPYTFDLGELGRYYRAYRGLMDHWRAVLPEGTLLEVQYERVVDDLEGQTRRLLDFCGLDWDPKCLDFHTSDRPVWTASAAQVRRPLYKTSVGRARPDAATLAPLLAGLGGN